MLEENQIYEISINLNKLFAVNKQEFESIKLGIRGKLIRGFPLSMKFLNYLFKMCVCYITLYEIT